MTKDTIISKIDAFPSKEMIGTQVNKYLKYELKYSFQEQLKFAKGFVSCKSLKEAKDYCKTFIEKASS